MFASTARRSHHPQSGKDTHVSIYKCYNRVQHRERCTGQTSYRAAKIEHAVLEQIEKRIRNDKQLQKLYKQFQQADLPIRKMILSQWIERVVVYSYERIEVYFAELEEATEIVQQVSAQF